MGFRPMSKKKIRLHHGYGAMLWWALEFGKEDRKHKRYHQLPHLEAHSYKGYTYLAPLMKPGLRVDLDDASPQGLLLAAWQVARRFERVMLYELGKDFIDKFP
jgi:hypothetical protein